eukprot:246150_1
MHKCTQAWEKIYLTDETHVWSTSGSHPIAVNKKEIFLGQYDKLCKFNRICNKWSEWINYPENVRDLYSSQTTCVDNREKTIYVYQNDETGINGILLIINYDTKDIQVIQNGNVTRTGYGHKIIFAHQQLHLIGGRWNDKHFIFNSKQKRFEILHTFEQFSEGMSGFGLVHCPSKQRILLIGGCNETINNDECLDEIYSYSTVNHTWTQLNIKLPEKICNFGCSVACNGEYVIILGGITDTDFSKNIYVIDMRNIKIMKSKVVCPVSKGFDSVIINDEIKRELIVFGYVRKCWKNEKMISMLFPPQYIIKMIQLWYLNEYVHLFQYASAKNHWKILVDDIINNVNK